MTPKERAEYLFNIMCVYPLTKEYGKYLAIKVAEEMITECIEGYSYSDYRNNYWELVKHEIERL